MSDKKSPKEASQLFYNIIKASVSPKATGSVAPKKKEEKKPKLPEIHGYVGVYESPSNEQLEMLDEAMDAAFKLFFKEDPTGRSNIIYGGVPIMPVDESGNVDIRDFLTKILLIYAKV